MIMYRLPIMNVRWDRQARMTASPVARVPEVQEPALHGRCGPECLLQQLWLRETIVKCMMLSSEKDRVTGSMLRKLPCYDFGLALEIYFQV